MSAQTLPTMIQTQRVWRFGRSFRWQVEYRVRPGFTRSSHDIPSWAQSPTANIIGDWDATRRRLTWFGIPLGLWRST